MTVGGKETSGGTSTARAGGPSLPTAAKLPWVLFLAMHAVLFLRPAELVPQLEDVPIYNFLIIACLVTSFGQVRKRLTVEALLRRPIDACVVGLLIAVVLSHLSQRRGDRHH